MEKENNKKYRYVLTAGFIFIILILGFSKPVFAKTGRTYTFCVGGTGTTSKYDIKRVKKVLTDNKELTFSKSKKYTEYIYNSNKEKSYGTKTEFNKNFAKAYEKISKDDLAVFMYSGDGKMNSKGKGVGLFLGGGKYYSYKELGKKLSSVKCKKMLIIINACGAEEFYKSAYGQFSSSLKKKTVMFLTPISEQKVFKKTVTSKGSYFINYLIAGLGYGGTVKADSNSDQKVTIYEIANYINKRITKQKIKGMEKLKESCYSRLKKDVLYQYIKENSTDTEKKPDVGDDTNSGTNITPQPNITPEPDNQYSSDDTDIDVF